MNIFQLGSVQQSRADAVHACLTLAVKNAMQRMTDRQLLSLVKAPLEDFRTCESGQTAAQAA